MRLSTVIWYVSGNHPSWGCSPRSKQRPLSKCSRVSRSVNKEKSRKQYVHGVLLSQTITTYLFVLSISIDKAVLMEYSRAASEKARHTHEHQYNRIDRERAFDLDSTYWSLFKYHAKRIACPFQSSVYWHFIGTVSSE